MQVAKDLKSVISVVSKDKNLDETIIVDALEQAMIHAARRTMGLTVDLEAHYNEEINEIELFQFKTVVEKVEDKDLEIIFDEATKHDSETTVGDALGFKIDTKAFGRISAMCAKQIIVQKVRDAERSQVHEEFKDRVGETLSGYVKRIERGDIIVDLGRTEAVVPYREQIPSERYKAKDRIQGYVMDVKRASRGPQVIMSRGHSGFLVNLFEQNVSEIYDGIVSIEGAARDAGSRSKIAVFSRDASVDPVGACVGMKGQRVQAIVQELNGEKIDIIPWDEDPARLVCNALAPAAVSKVIVDEDNQSMEVIVSDDQLSLAIGKKGQNVRLAAQLSGWRLDIKSESKLDEASAGAKIRLAQLPGLGIMRADILVNEGIKSVEDLAETAIRSIERALNVDSEEANRIKEAAASMVGKEGPDLETIERERQELLANSSAAPKVEEEKAPAVDTRKKERTEMFLKLNGVGEAAASALADANYGTVGDIIADSPEELSEKTGLPISIAKTVQMAADKYWQVNKPQQVLSDD